MIQALCWFSSASWNIFLMPWDQWSSEVFSSPKIVLLDLDLLGLIQIVQFWSVSEMNSIALGVGGYFPQ